jgi:hypothetical protein
MTQKKGHLFSRFFVCGLLVTGMLLAFITSVSSTIPASAQQPTGYIPTVTGTPKGPSVIVYSDQDIIGVFAGPDAYLYDQVGILLAGEEAPALGYSLDGEWIQIIYLGTAGGKGWIYAPFVGVLRGSELPVLPNPPTATPRTTPTIDPTQAALFGLQLTPARLATYTEPPPLEIPSYEYAEETGSGFPMGMLILGLLLIGILGAVISFLRPR